MARRYGLSFWLAILVFAATFVSAPKDTAELSWDIFRGVGEFGGAVVSELVNSDTAGEVQ